MAQQEGKPPVLDAPPEPEGDDQDAKAGADVTDAIQQEGDDDDAD